MALTGADLLLPGDDRQDGGGASGGIRLRHTKAGRDQFAPLHDPVVIGYLRSLRAATPLGARFSPLSAVQFNAALGWACSDLGLSVLTAHCLRRGAASRAALRGIHPRSSAAGGGGAVHVLLTFTCSRLKPIVLTCRLRHGCWSQSGTPLGGGQRFRPVVFDCACAQGLKVGWCFVATLGRGQKKSVELSVL